MLAFANRFSQCGSSLNRLWLENFFLHGDEASYLFTQIEANSQLQLQYLDLGHNPSLAEEIEALASLLVS